VQRSILLTLAREETLLRTLLRMPEDADLGCRRVPLGWLLRSLASPDLLEKYLPSAPGPLGFTTSPPVEPGAAACASP
jgi:hypothetical protein